MNRPQMQLGFEQELVVDLFAGGGGASTGIARAYREPDVAVNHDAVAVSVHRANHPKTQHHQADVFEVDPLTATQGRPVGLLWASPDCRHHSKAKGRAPRSRRVRGLAWVALRWLLDVAPRMLELENVEEFVDWGPLDAEGYPIESRKGETFRAFVAALSTGLPADHPAMREIVEFLGEGAPVAALVRGLGYTCDWRELRACDYGANTIRKRLVFKARRDGRPITWAAKTHGLGLKPYGTAADCIDWTIPGRTIFRDKPMARNTLRRVAKGLWRHVLNNPKPYIVPGCAPFLTEFANASNQRTFDADEPLRTQVAQVKGGHFALVSACLEQANGGWYDGEGRSITEPLSTICTSGANQRLVSAYFVKYYGNERDGISLCEPMHTVTTKDRIGLVQSIQIPRSALTAEQWAKAKRCADFLREHLPEQFPHEADAVLVGDLVLVDITLRMLVPRELARAQGFGEDYILDRGLFETYPGSGVFEWRPVTKTEQVRLIGNSVCPDMAHAEVRNDLGDLIECYARQAA